MRALSAEFVTSVIAGGAIGAGPLPIVAMVGRSNVGKSSLINALVKRRIARSGAKPGTTRLLNLYRVTPTGPASRGFLIADLPGYGYARGGAQAQHDFEQLTDGFFAELDQREAASSGSRPRLAGVMLVVDARHPDLASDRQARAWIGSRSYPFVTVVTKVDCVVRSRRDEARRRHSAALDCPVVLLSTRTGEGVGKVWAAIADLL